MLQIIVFVLLSSSVFAAGWNKANSPYKMGNTFENSSLVLPESGELKDKRTGWPGSHWASYLGSIAHRWSSGNPQNFKYQLLSLEELKTLEPHQLEELSPAEKFDIYNGNYDYPTVKQVFRLFSPYENEWHGICHGYAPAALNHPEPASKEMTNPDGLNIYFYSSDVAGLMSFYYSDVKSTPVTLVGSRCRYSSSRIPFWGKSNCEDMNAGSFHLILANKLGLKGEGVIVDIDRYAEVWNHIAVSYTSNYRSEVEPASSSAAGTVSRILVESTVTYAAAIAPKFDPVLGTESAEYLHHTYEYYLDLDKNKKIIGGDWISEGYPDFMWTQEKAEFTNNWSSMNQIYSPAQMNQP